MFKFNKKIFKKFKLILNLSIQDYSIKFITPLKSILSQSGILEAPLAENYLQNIFEIFFYEFYEIISLKYVFDDFNKLYYEKINIFINTVLYNLNNYNWLHQTINWFKLLEYLYLSKILNINFKLKYNSIFYNNIFFLVYFEFDNEDVVQINNNIDSNIDNNKVDDNNSYKSDIDDDNNNIDIEVVNNEINKLEEDSNDNSVEEDIFFMEFKLTTFLFPCFIYIYKKELKNIFTILNFVSSFFFNKFLMFRRLKYVSKYFKISFEFILRKKYFLLLLLKWKKLRKKKIIFFKKKFRNFFLCIELFKISLIKNFYYLYFNYFNYFYLFSSFLSLLGSYVSFYRYFFFKKRKVNFRRKIRKNMLIESQYI